MRSLWINAPGIAELRDIEDPVPEAGQALLSPLYTGLCGTDLELFRGGMPYLASGDASYPILLGHETVAQVIRCDDGLSWIGALVVVDPVVGCGTCVDCAEGRATLCAERFEMGIRRGMPGAAAEWVVAPMKNLHRVPDWVDPRDAVLTEPGVTALHAIARTNAFAGPDALVVGAGTLGLITAMLLIEAGVDVSVDVGGSGREQLVESIGACPAGRDVDRHYYVAIEAAGTPSAVQRALGAVRAGGRVALTGVQAEDDQRFRPNDVVLRNLTVHGILNGPGLYDDLIARLTGLGRLSDVVVGAVHPLEAFDVAMADLAADDRERPKVLLKIGVRTSASPGCG